VHKPDSFKLHLFDEVVKLNYHNNLEQSNDDNENHNDSINDSNKITNTLHLDTVERNDMIVAEIKEITGAIKEMREDFKKMKNLFDECFHMFVALSTRDGL
jgi:hypothetical protein